MSTRGAVGWYEDDGSWNGVFNHWDSYPTGLLQSLLTLLYKRPYNGDLTKLLAKLKTFGDWRQMLTNGVCVFCGKKTGQPHSYSGPCLGADKLPKNGVFPDPQCKHHAHNDPDPKKEQFDPRTDPLFLEWVYLLRPQTREIEVWAHSQYYPKTFKALQLRWSGTVQPLKASPGVVSYTHVFVGSVPVDRRAPKKGKLAKLRRLGQLAECCSGFEEVGAKLYDRIHKRAVRLGEVQNAG